jgi:hypothetical protein
VLKGESPGLPERVELGQGLTRRFINHHEGHRWKPYPRGST